MFGPTYFSRIPKLGVGLGLNAVDARPAYVRLVGTAIDYFEVADAEARHLGPPSYTDVVRKCSRRLTYLDARDYVRLGHSTIIHGSTVNPLYGGAPDPRDHDALRELTRATRTPWVTEDLGVWMMRERHVYPFFLPMALTEESLAVAVENVRNFQAAVGVPFTAEIPSFSVLIGDLHVFDYFRRLAHATGCGVCIDLGHLLSYQLATHTSPTANLHRLPWDSVVELHISGGSLDQTLDGVHYVDSHGDTEAVSVCWDLLDAALEMGPNVRAVTLEVFGARDERRVIERIRELRAHPSVASWSGGSAAEPRGAASTRPGCGDRVTAVAVATADLLQGATADGLDAPLGGHPLAPHYAPSERRRWRRVRTERVRAFGTSLASYYPSTMRWLLRRGPGDEAALHERLIGLLPGSDVPLEEKLPTAMSALVASDPSDAIGAELARVEAWMNGCAQRRGEVASIDSPVDIVAVMDCLRDDLPFDERLCGRPVAVVHTGGCRFVRQYSDDAGAVAEVVIERSGS